MPSQGIQAYSVEEAKAAGSVVWVMPFASAIESDGSVAATERIVPAGVVSDLSIHIITNTVSAESTVTMEIDDVDSALSVSITASTTGQFTDNSNAPSVSTDQKITYRIDVGATGTTLGWDRIRAVFNATVDTVSLHGINAASSVSHSQDSDTRYLPVKGARDLDTDQDLVSYEIRAAFTWQDLRVNVGNCSRTTDVIVTGQINTSDGNQSVTMDGGADNTTYHDSSNTDTLTAGDLINWASTTGTGSGEGFNYEKIGCTLISTASQWFEAAQSSISSPRVDDGVTAFWPAGGMMGNENLTEADTEISTAIGFTARQLNAHIDRMSGTVDVTYTLRADGADGNMSVALSAVGRAEDTSNTDTIAVDAAINFQTTSPVGGVNYDTNYIGYIGENAAGGNLKRTAVDATVRAIRRTDLNVQRWRSTTRQHGIHTCQHIRL